MAGHITIMTFGYKFGPPGPGFKHIADVRNIPAVFAEPDQKGTDPKVKAAVMAKPAAKAWLAKMEKWSLSDGDKVAIGCARGHHRSVAVASEYASYLRGQGYSVTLNNRDISKKYSLSIGEYLLYLRNR